jgi:hypothetical protein
MVPGLDSNRLASGYEADERQVLFSPGLKLIRQPDLHRSLADTSGVRRFLRFGGVWKWSGTSVLPRVSRRSERRGLLPSSCPNENLEPRGIAPRSTPCHCIVLLLCDGPKSGAHARTRTG